MKPERWQEIERIYSTASALEPSLRAAFLNEVCGGCESVRHAVELLLASQPEQRNSVETPSSTAAGRTADEDTPHPGTAAPGSPTLGEASLNEGALIDGKYRVECRLGQGGMGTVYRVRHADLDKTFALKLIRPPEGEYSSFADRFRIEAKALGRLKHPHIVDVTDYGVDSREQELPYLVMEYLAGQTLRERIYREGPLSPAEALPWLEQIARAVDYAHQQGVLHCDLKPGNILLTGGDGGPEVAKILDFGLARMIQPGFRVSTAASEEGTARGLVSSSGQSTRISTIEEDAGRIETVVGAAITDRPHAPAELHPAAGTPAYMPPEVIRGESPAEAADIYALGVLAYELLVGKPPFTGSALGILECHLRWSPPKPSALGASLSEDVEKALLAPLAKDPVQRPRTAVEMVEAIRTAHLAAERRKWMAREMPRRLALSAVLTMALGLVSLPLLNSQRAQRLERQTVDVRFALQPPQAPDPRILIITIDDASLAADQTLLSDRADEFGAQLARIHDAGARGIAVDFLLPPSWSRSASFSQFVLRSAPALTLAAFSSPSGEVIGTTCLAGLTASALGPDRVRSLFGFVNLDEDPDGITRRARFWYSDSSGGKWDTWAMRAARRAIDPTQLMDSGGRQREFFWIDHSAEWQNMERIAWKDLSQRLESDRSVFRDRLVLVGGDYVAAGDDYHRVPAHIGSSRAVSGIVLEALIVNTILGGFPIREAGESARHLAVVFLCATASVGVLCFPRLSLVAILCGSLGLLYLLGAFLLFRWSNLILPAAGPLAMGLTAVAVSAALRQRLSDFPPRR